MKYQETGRLGRITKNMRKLGFEDEMDDILYDSLEFPCLHKKEQTKYIDMIMERMEKRVGLDNTTMILKECGAQCCGKSWSNFVRQIWNQSESEEDFFSRLNHEEKKYATYISYDSSSKIIFVSRDKCICGLINKGDVFQNSKVFCNCSIGHMSVFFNTIFKVVHVELLQSIYAGAGRCEWKIKLED